ncbi:putative signal peptide protein [Puccinia sorghi]|uniref:Putative signal peptide protein n=1 Tax=Puccinia sorghi TaxID=27349 RepID=A0A0L6V5Q4_9BASI|nr:putative signal peptide protein [Puccinia sorghi]
MVLSWMVCTTCAAAEGRTRRGCDTSGNGGLLEALIEFGLAHRLWDALSNMIGDHRAAQAEGDSKLHDPLDILMAVPGAFLSDTGEDTDWDRVSKSTRGRPSSSMLTAEERALDDDADDEEESSVPEGTNIIQPPSSNSSGPPLAAPPISESNPSRLARVLLGLRHPLEHCLEDVPSKRSRITKSESWPGKTNDVMLRCGWKKPGSRLGWIVK